MSAPASDGNRSRYLLTIESDFFTDKRGELEELSEYFGRTGQYGAAEEYWELIGDQPVPGRN